MKWKGIKEEEKTGKTAGDCAEEETTDVSMWYKYGKPDDACLNKMAYKAHSDQNYNTASWAALMLYLCLSQRGCAIAAGKSTAPYKDLTELSFDWSDPQITVSRAKVLRAWLYYTQLKPH